MFVIFFPPHKNLKSDVCVEGKELDNREEEEVSRDWLVMSVIPVTQKAVPLVPRKTRPFPLFL